MQQKPKQEHRNSLEQLKKLLSAAIYNIYDN